MRLLAKLGKFLNINVEEQASTDVAAGIVISQDPVGYTDDDPTYGNPDVDTITITVSTGTQESSADTSSSRYHPLILRLQLQMMRS